MRRIKYIPLIGSYMKVLSSANIYYEGLSGYIVDETANMIIFRDERDGKIKMIPKKGSRFYIRAYDNREYTVDGKYLIGDIVRRLIRDG